MVGEEGEGVGFARGYGRGGWHCLGGVCAIGIGGFFFFMFFLGGVGFVRLSGEVLGVGGFGCCWCV